jgi:hypothetical protein
MQNTREPKQLDGYSLLPVLSLLAGLASPLLFSVAASLPEAAPLSWLFVLALVVDSSFSFGTAVEDLAFRLSVT